VRYETPFAGQTLAHGKIFARSRSSTVSLPSHNRPVGTVGYGLASGYAVISNIPSSLEILSVVVPTRTTQSRMF